MAHYLAEKMALTENTTGDDKVNAEAQCFETILNLWKHRSYYPSGRRPFENFERIFHTLERLDPDNPNPYFYSTMSDAPRETFDDIQQWLDIALGIDQAARVWLEYVFQQAAQAATDEKTIKWMENSMGLPNGDDVSAIAHLLVIYENDDNNKTSRRIEQSRLEEIESRIKKLDAFIEFSRHLRAEFSSKLEEIESRINAETDTAT